MPLIPLKDSGLTNLHLLAEKLHASEAHLSKVLQTLARHGLVHSTRGPAGGFCLARSAGRISLLEIFEAIDGSFRPSACLFDTVRCQRFSCLMSDLVERCNSLFFEYLSGKKLSDIVETDQNDQKP